MAALFLAGVIPGIVVGLMLMLVSLMLSLRTGALRRGAAGITHFPEADQP